MSTWEPSIVERTLALQMQANRAFASQEDVVQYLRELYDQLLEPNHDPDPT